MLKTQIFSGAVALFAPFCTGMSAQAQTYVPCPELEQFMTQTTPLHRQLMAANDEFYPVTNRIQAICDRRAQESYNRSKKKKISKKATNAEDLERISASSDRGEYADLGKQ